MRKLLLLLIGLFAYYSASAADTTVTFTLEELRFIQDHPIIRIGVDPSFVPFEFIDSKGSYKGIAADILAIISERTGLQFDLAENLTWQEVTNKALQREIDVLPAIGKTIEREQFFLFSQPYITFQRIIAIRNSNTSITSFDDLFGRQVAVQANSSHHGMLLNYPEITLRTYDTVESALKAVNRGEEVAFIGNEATTHYVASANGMTELSFIPIENGSVERLHMAVRNDWPHLVSILNKALDSIDEAEFSKIYQHWIIVDHRFDYKPFIIAAVIIGILFLVVFGVSAFWISRLRKALVIKDIAQTKMEEAIRKAESADREKSRFMARMSHEIRTPLNGINGMAYLLEGAALDATQRRYLATISQATKNMLAIINDIIDYSRMEERQIPIEHVPFKLDEVVQHIISLESHAIREKNLHLQFEWGSNVPVHVIGDSNRVGQILTNLIHNAIKFTEQGTIGIRTYCTALESVRCRVMFEISDTGIGISEEVQQRLFKPFSQADESISRKYGGSGLGLSIVKTLVEMLDGTLSLSSEPGRGSLFSFELPFAIDLAGPAEDTQRLASVDLSLISILVLAKDEETRRAIEIALRRFGISADYIGSSRLALQLISIEQSRYQVLIIDFTADTSVESLLTSIGKDFLLADRPKTVVFLSDGTRIDDPEDSSAKLRQLGADIILPKPILPSLVFNSILDLLSKDLLTEPSGGTKHESTEGREATILVVEDNAVNRTIAYEVLTQKGYRVLLAENGAIGCDRFSSEQESIDLILMDLHMDVMDGFEATQRIRTKDKHIPIFALTADVVGDIHKRCADAGFTRIVSKPYDPKQLLQLIKEAIPQVKATLTKEERETFSPSRGLERIDGDTVLFVKILTLFREETSVDMPRLQQAVEQKDWQQVDKIAHKLKGSARTIGAEKFADIAKQLQHASTKSCSSVPQLFDDMKTEHIVLLTEVDRLIGTIGIK